MTAQTVGAVSWRAAKVEFSANGGSTWTDISGAENGVAVDGGDRQTGVAFTDYGDTGVITSGKRDPLNVTVNALYTEVTSEAYDLYAGCYEADTPISIRWSPKGGGVGTFQFTALNGVPVSQPYPQGNTGPDAIPLMIKGYFASIIKAVVA